MKSYRAKFQEFTAKRDLPTCSSEEDGETRRSRIDGGGNGKLLDLVG